MRVKIPHCQHVVRHKPGFINTRHNIEQNISNIVRDVNCDLDFCVSYIQILCEMVVFHRRIFQEIHAVKGRP